MRHLRLTEEQLAEHKRKTNSGWAFVAEKPKPKNKYRNLKTVVDGIEFHSRKEAKRWNELRLLESTDRIAGLQRQVRYSLDVGLVHICEYIADFVYRENADCIPDNKRIVVEDVKGYRQGNAYQMFTLKKRLMKACYGIEVIES